MLVLRKLPTDITDDDFFETICSSCSGKRPHNDAWHLGESIRNKELYVREWLCGKCVRTKYFREFTVAKLTGEVTT